VAKTRAFDENTERYDTWFDRHAALYQSELAAVRALLPASGEGVEIGVGTGRFAVPLGIGRGVEPSAPMRRMARARGIDAVGGLAESLPYEDGCFDFLLMVTTICFVDDVRASLEEASRVLKPGGAIIVGFVDRESPVGRHYVKHKDESPFYRDAVFLSAAEVSRHLERAGFVDLAFMQTVFGGRSEPGTVEAPREGCGDGSFVVVRATKPGPAARPKS
jgi:SAM-dependent methyltransferase